MRSEISISAEGELRVGDFTLRAPLTAHGNSKLFEDVAALPPSQLRELAGLLNFTVHPEHPIKELRYLVGGELQLAWKERLSGIAPEKWLKDQQARVQKHEVLLEKLNKGEIVMSKSKSKGEKKVRVSSELATFKLFRSKIEESKKLRPFLAKESETKRHDGIIVQAMASGDKMMLADIVKVAQATNRYKTKDNLAASVRWHLHKLVTEGFVQLAETT